MVPMTNRSRRTVLIAGMHRSGTSAFARIANFLGAELGANFMPQRPATHSGTGMKTLALCQVPIVHRNSSYR